MRQNAIKIVNYLNILALCWLLCCAIFTPCKLNNYWLAYGGYYLFFTTWSLEFVIEKRWKSWRWNKKTLYFTLFLALFALALIYAPFDGRKYFKILLEKRYALLGFGIVGLFGVNKRYHLRLLMHVIILTALACVVGLIGSIGIGTFVQSPDRAQLLTEARIAHINAHMMFNFYLNIALICIGYILIKSWRTLHWAKIAAYILTALTLFSTLLLSEGRSGFLACLFNLSALFVLLCWRRNAKWCYIITPIVMATAVFVASQHHRISREKFDHELRLIYWENALDVIADQPLLGHGMSHAQEAFDCVSMNNVEESTKAYWQAQRVPFIDSHNQYIQIVMEFGIMGLILVLCIYMMPIFIATASKRILACYICSLCAFQSIFDMFVTGQFCPLFCMLMLMLLRIPDKQQPLPNAKQNHSSSKETIPHAI